MKENIGEENRAESFNMTEDTEFVPCSWETSENLSILTRLMLTYYTFDSLLNILPNK